jgi:CheY-like chemotaxis protein
MSKGTFLRGRQNHMVILIADDEADIRNLVKITLEENGYTVLTAQNGKEAWDILRTRDVNLVILDVMMPVMDGFNLLLKIREHSTIPVMFLTARTEDMDKMLMTKVGMYSSKMEFQQGKKYTNIYSTPYGSFDLEYNTILFENKLNEKGRGSVYAEYVVTFADSDESYNKLSIDII